MPPLMTGSKTDVGSTIGLPANGAVRRPAAGAGDPATLLQYSAAYGNPHLRPNSAQWLPSQHLYARLEPPPYSVVRGGGVGATGGGGGGGNVVVVGKRKQQQQQNAAVDGAANNRHIGVAKRQTLATHV